MNKIVKVCIRVCATLIFTSSVVFGMEEDERRPPEHKCPITLEVMKDPVVAADGHSYERGAILTYFKMKGAKSPSTGLLLKNTDLIENHALRLTINKWRPGRQRGSSELEAREAASIAQRAKEESRENTDLLTPEKGVKASLDGEDYIFRSINNLTQQLKELRLSNALMKKELKELRAAVDSADGEGKQDDFPAFSIISSSSYPSNSAGEIEVVKPILIATQTQSTTFSFDTWRHRLLSIKAPWSKVIWQRWTHSNLKSLDLYHNQIGSEGGKRLGEALKFNTSLLYLNLANNLLGDEGATAIGEALEVNTTLLELNFNLNKIGNKGAIALGEGLKSNTTLQFMSLRYNKFNAEGKVAITKNAHCKIDFKARS